MSLYKVNRPISVKIDGKPKVFPKSKRPQEIPDASLKGLIFQTLLKNGDLVKVEAAAPAKAPAPAAK